MNNYKSSHLILDLVPAILHDPSSATTSHLPSFVFLCHFFAQNLVSKAQNTHFGKFSPPLTGGPLFRINCYIYISMMLYFYFVYLIVFVIQTRRRGCEWLPSSLLLPPLSPLSHQGQIFKSKHGERKINKL